MSFERVFYTRLGEQQSGAGFQLAGHSSGIAYEEAAQLGTLVALVDDIGVQKYLEAVTSEGQWVYLAHITKKSQGRTIIETSAIAVRAEEYRRVMQNPEAWLGCEDSAFLTGVSDAAAVGKPEQVAALDGLPVSGERNFELAALRTKYNLNDEVYAALVRGAYSCLLVRGITMLSIGVGDNQVTPAVARELVYCIMQAMPAALRAQLTFRAGAFPVSTKLLVENASDCRNRATWIDLTTGEHNIPALSEECFFVEHLIKESGTPAGQQILREMDRILDETKPYTTADVGFHARLISGENNNNVIYLLLAAYLAAAGMTGREQISDAMLGASINVLAVMPLSERFHLDEVISELLVELHSRKLKVNSAVLRNLENCHKKSSSEKFMDMFTYTAAASSAEELGRLLGNITSMQPRAREVRLLSMILRTQRDNLVGMGADDWYKLETYCFGAVHAQVEGKEELHKCYLDMLSRLKGEKLRARFESMYARTDVTFDDEQRRQLLLTCWDELIAEGTKLPNAVEAWCEETRDITNVEILDRQYLVYLQNKRFGLNESGALDEMRKVYDRKPKLMDAFWKATERVGARLQQYDSYLANVMFPKREYTSEESCWKDIQTCLESKLERGAHTLEGKFLQLFEKHLKGLSTGERIEKATAVLAMVAGCEPLKNKIKESFWNAFDFRSIELGEKAKYEKIAHPSHEKFRKCMELCCAYEHIKRGVAEECDRVLVELVAEEWLVKDAHDRERILIMIKPDLDALGVYAPADLIVLRFFSNTKEIKRGTRTTHIAVEKLIAWAEGEGIALDDKWIAGSSLLASDAMASRALRGKTKGEEISASGKITVETSETEIKKRREREDAERKARGAQKAWQGGVAQKWMTFIYLAAALFGMLMLVCFGVESILVNGAVGWTLCGVGLLLCVTSGALLFLRCDEFLGAVGAVLALLTACLEFWLGYWYIHVIEGILFLVYFALVIIRVLRKERSLRRKVEKQITRACQLGSRMEIDGTVEVNERLRGALLFIGLWLVTLVPLFCIGIQTILVSGLLIRVLLLVVGAVLGLGLCALLLLLGDPFSFGGMAVTLLAATLEWFFGFWWMHLVLFILASMVAALMVLHAIYRRKEELRSAKQSRNGRR